jgi:4'-phosphopantetheinyl transferase
MWQCLHTASWGQVWHADLSRPPSDGSAQILSAQERARAQRLVREQDRQRFINAHVGLRTLLSDHTQHPAELLEFAEGPFGKPFLPAHDGLQFNLSHSQHRALVAISQQCEVGVDIEQMRDLHDADGLVQRYFSAAEQADWGALPPSERLAAFHQAWSRKEACVKAVGWGLSVPLEGVEVGIQDLAREVHLQLPNGQQILMGLESLSLEAGWFGAVAWVKSIDKSHDGRMVRV